MTNYESSLAIAETQVIAELEGSHHDSLRVLDDGLDSYILMFSNPIAASALAWEASEVKAEIRITKKLLRELVKKMTKKSPRRAKARSTK